MAEFERLKPIIKAGGFIPSVDHQTPPSVPLENYRIFLKLFNEYTSLIYKGCFMNSKERVLTTVANKPADRVPVNYLSNPGQCYREIPG